MKIFTCGQVGEIDRYTIENEPVSSIDLMERAAGRLFDWITARYDRSEHFVIFTGPGNNGGDGLALSRMLHSSGYHSAVYHIQLTEKVSPDWKTNFERLSGSGHPPVTMVENSGDLPVLSYDDIIVDAVFGSGLTRTPEGISADAIRFMNNSGCKIISIDMPSGLFGEDNSGNNRENIVRAGTTLTFQFPKLAMMFHDNYPFTGNWYALPIGLHEGKIRETATPYYYNESSDIASILHKRGKFDHKGIYGHGLLVAGSKEKAGAAVLSSRAALRTGIGLLTCHTASEATAVIQAAVPEAMISTDKDEKIITSVDDTVSYSAIGIGPGTGTRKETAAAVMSLIKSSSKPMVIDADAINILSVEKDKSRFLREGMILTPHLKEFERIAGKSADAFSRMKLQKSFTEKYGCIVVLKGAYSSISMPDGRVFFNSTGNPGMATGGSGDVLTGIILSLLAQGYNPEEAAITGVFLHGLAGDIAAETIPYESVIASDITDNIGNAFIRIRENNE